MARISAQTGPVEEPGSCHFPSQGPLGLWPYRSCGPGPADSAVVLCPWGLGKIHCGQGSVRLVLTQEQAAMDMGFLIPIEAGSGVQSAALPPPTQHNRNREKPTPFPSSGWWLFLQPPNTTATHHDWPCRIRYRIDALCNLLCKPLASYLHQRPHRLA